MTKRLQTAALTLTLTLSAAVAHAQISLASAVDLTFKANPKVQAAQADVDKARAALSEAKDAYVPIVQASGGIGKSSGVPTAVPTIFTITGQSLIFNYSQRDYIRAAHAGWNSAQLALQQAKDDAAEDVVTTYLALDNAQQRRDAATEALDHAKRFAQIVSDRVDAGQDAHIEIPKSHRTVAQLQQQLLHLNSEIASLSDHLSRITGLSTANLQAVHDSIPALPPPATPEDMATGAIPTNPGVLAAFANERAKMEQARGDARYLYRPQLSLGANYSRISTDFTSYGVYYPAFNTPGISRNALSIGIEIQVPLLDQTHRSKARESAAEARRAHAEAITAQNNFLEGHLKLEHAANELELQAEIARDDRDIAKDQLEAVLIQLTPEAASASATPLTPKDEQQARLSVAQKQLDLLNTELQLQQAEIQLYRQNGQLATWLHSAISSQ